MKFEKDHSSHTIVPLSSEYVEGAVEMHMVAFRDFFLTFLGKGFLREMYNAAVDHPLSVSYVAINQNGEVLGATLGFIDSRKYYRDIFRKRWFRFAWQASFAALKKPSIVPRLFRATRHTGYYPPCDIRPLAALPSTAVKPGVQGLGLAIGLMRKACEEFVNRGIDAVYLTTDRDNNDRVRGFYEALGWELLGYYTTAEGRRMCWYIWQNPKTRKSIKQVNVNDE